MKISLTLIITFVFIFASQSVSNCQILLVPGDYPGIQEGINAAKNGDTVLVADGEYFENIHFRGKRIVVGSLFIIDGDTRHIVKTIINGSKSTQKDTGSCVVFGPGEDSTATLEGFTITGGTGTSYVFGGGAAIFREGGGIMLHKSSATIKHNIIIGNEAKVIPGVRGGGGGGISSMYGNPQILNNYILNNKATYAAGMVLNWSGGKVRNNIISGNSGGGQYGTAGLMIWQSRPWSVSVENNTIVDNHSSSVAGGLSVEKTSAVIRNNIIRGNTQKKGKQVIGIENSVFEYCDTEENYEGNGNISISPDLDYTTFALKTGSGCIDAGSPEAKYKDKENLVNPGHAARPSLGGLRNDIGAFGGPGAAVMPEVPGLKKNKK